MYGSRVSMYESCVWCLVYVYWCRVITTEYITSVYLSDMVERAPYIGYVWRLRAHIVYGI